MINGPDPDKDTYRFAINGQASRWKAIRERALAICTAAAVAEVDQAIEEMTKPENLEDATHARDLADAMKRHLDSIELLFIAEPFEQTVATPGPDCPALGDPRTPPPARGNIAAQQSTTLKWTGVPAEMTAKITEAVDGRFIRQIQAKHRDTAAAHARQDDLLARAKANAVLNAGRGLSVERLQAAGRTLKPATWAFMPLHREIADASAVLMLNNVEEASPTTYAADVRITSKPFDGRVRIVWAREGHFEDALEEAESRGLNVVQLSFELSAVSPDVRICVSKDPAAGEWIAPLELVEVTKQTGPRTALPDLPVRITETMPPEDADLLGESREEMEARLAQVKAIAGVYRAQVDPRDPVRIAADDLAAAEKNRTAKAADKPLVASWSDTPLNQQKLAAILKQLYEGVGMSVESVQIVSGHAVIVFNNPHRSLGVSLPPELKALLDSNDASTRK